MKAVSSKSTHVGNDRKGPKDSYRSWDPLTQSKFLLDLHRQLGNPISQADAYRIAMAAFEQDAKTDPIAQ